jgi:hypothetical protein
MGVVKFESKRDKEIKECNKKIEELSKEAEQRRKELDAIIDVPDEEFDAVKCFAAMSRVLKASNALAEACQSHPNYKGNGTDDIFELAGKIYDQKVVPAFSTDEELDQYIEENLDILRANK